MATKRSKKTATMRSRKAAQKGLRQDGQESDVSFDGKEILIRLGDDNTPTFRFRPEQLASIDFFRKYGASLPWPKQFALPPKSQGSGWHIIEDPDATHVPESTDDATETNKAASKRTVTAKNDAGVDSHASFLNQIIFVCVDKETAVTLFARDASLDHTRIFRDTAWLAVSYGCSQQIKDRIANTLTQVLGYDGETLRAYPLLLLETSVYLRNERLYQSTLPYAAGARLTISKTASISPVIAKLVEEHSQTLKSKLYRICISLSQIVLRDEDFPSMIAWTIFSRFLNHHLFSAEIGSVEMYRSLRYLENCTSGMELVEKTGLQHLLDSVQNVENGLNSGREAIDAVFNQCDYDNCNEDLVALDQANREYLNVKSVKSNLKIIVREAKVVVEPLLRDKNMEYFLAEKFKGPFPWEVKES